VAEHIVTPKMPVPGLVPGIRVFVANISAFEYVNGRDKPGHIHL
jgi:hypothetical protein